MLRIHFILMRIWILDPHWKKWIRIQVISIKCTEFFLTKQNFQFCCFIFFAYFYPKTWWPIRNQEYFISLFSLVHIWGLRVNFLLLQFFVDFCPLDPDPWIRIFFRIRIQEAKILWIQRIRILSTVHNDTLVTFI